MSDSVNLTPLGHQFAHLSNGTIDVHISLGDDSNTVPSACNSGSHVVSC